MSTLAITGGRVLLPDATVERADVLVDREAGTIREVGSDLAADAEETLDATGGLVTPGFVNGHCHVAMTLLRGYADDKPLKAWLREDIWPAEGALTPEDVRAGAELGVLEMIKGGTTAFADMYFHVPEIAAVVEEAGVRARLGHGIVTVGKDDEAAHADAAESIDVAREYDGAGDGRISTAFMPHSLTTVGEDYLEEFVPKAREAGVPVHYHANETAGEVEPIVDEREIELLAEAGTGVVHCPASNMKLASGAAPVERMLEAGVTVGLGTDGAASNNDLSMLDEARDAAMLGKLAAEDASAVPASAVVDCLTRGSADAVGLESGRLEAGAPADLAVIDLEAPHLVPAHDLVSHLAYAAASADVRHTVCDGRVLMRDREALTLDEPVVLERARDRAESLAARAGD